MKKTFLKNSLVFLILLMILTCIQSPILNADNISADRNDILDSVKKCIDNSSLLNNKFGSIEVLGNVTEIYDINENLFGYVVDTIFNDSLGYILVSADKSHSILEASEQSFINEEGSINAGTNEKSSKKFIFAGPMIHIIKYESNDGDRYYDIKSKEEISSNRVEELKKDSLSLEEFNNEKLSNSNKSDNSLASPLAYSYGYLEYDVPIVNQMDFYPSYKQNYGCGAASGAILAWYIGTNHSSYSNLTDGYYDAQELGNTDMYDLMAGDLGILPYEYKIGFNDYLELQGYSNTITEAPNSAGKSSIWSTLRTCIKTKNIPVSMFLGLEKSSGSYPEPEMPGLHWITITGWDEDGSDKYVTLESWGDWYYENYDALWAWRNSICLEYLNVTVPR